MNIHISTYTSMCHVQHVGGGQGDGLGLGRWGGRGSVRREWGGGSFGCVVRMRLTDVQKCHMRMHVHHAKMVLYLHTCVYTHIYINQYHVVLAC